MSTGYARAGQPNSPRRCEIIAFVPPSELARVTRELFDPFVTSGRCDASPSGSHQLISSRADIVCAHCAAIFWSG